MIRFVNLQNRTCVTLAIVIGMLVLVNVVLVRKLTLQRYRFQPSVVLNEHGWPLPAVRLIITYNLPAPGTDFQDEMFADVERRLLPDDIKMSAGGSVAFKDGSKAKISLHGLLVDLVIMFVFLLLVAVVCERWIFKPASKNA